MVEFGTYYPQYNVSFTAGDVFRVSVEGGVVKYKKNGVAYHTSPGIVTYPLKVDSALYTTNSTLTNAVVGGNWSGGSSGGSSSSSEVLWLVADHLGTPRMILDQSGSLANIKRHDYLPFGEEIQAGTGGRTTGQGYSQPDGTRQRYTGAERDDETGSDFMQARYYGSTLGRFTTPDDFLNDTHVADPQSWNLYAYVRNNPLRYIDPSGQIKRDANGNVITEERKDNDPYTTTINGRTYYVAPYQAQGSDGKTYSVVWEVKKVNIFADNGDKIKAYQTTGEMQLVAVNVDNKGNVTPISDTLIDAKQSKGLIESLASKQDLPLSNITNCHGTTFASGQVWIENDQVGALMKGDGYRQLGKSEAAQVSDVGIYGNADHSVRVNSVNPQGVVDVISKGGITRQRKATPGPGAGTAWANPADKLRYFTQRPKPKK